MPSYKKVSTLYDSCVKTIYKNVYAVCERLKKDKVKDKTEILEKLNDHLRNFLHGRSVL